MTAPVKTTLPDAYEPLRIDGAVLTKIGVVTQAVMVQAVICVNCIG
jgi:hypothetical protein